MTFFLLTYDRQRSASSIETFGDARSAQGAYAHRELQMMDDKRYEVVLLSAESEEQLRTTHSRYFSAPLLFA